MSGPTPGPYEAMRTGIATAVVTANDRQYVIAEVYPGHHHEAVDANARLLAAAPEMLIALKLFINPTGHTDACMEMRSFGVEGCTASCRAALAAIAKAEDSQ